MKNLVVCLPIRRGPGILINVLVREYRAFNIYIYIYIYIYVLQCPIERHRLFTAVCGVITMSQ